MVDLVNLGELSLSLVDAASQLKIESPLFANTNTFKTYQNTNGDIFVQGTDTSTGQFFAFAI